MNDVNDVNVLQALSARHRGNLTGALSDARVPSRVRLIMDPEVARQGAMQHLVWMLANLLARQSVEIQELLLDIPPGIVVTPALSPLVTPNRDLAESLRQGIASIHPDILLPQPPPTAEIAVRIGPGVMPTADLALMTTAHNWCGYVGASTTQHGGEDDNPIGAYVAACLCAGEIFKFVRGMRPEAGTYAHHLWLDAYRLRVTTRRPPIGPSLPSEIMLPPGVLVGAGAVGTGLLQTLYALARVRGELTVIDGDPQGIDLSNLNRYMLFGLHDVGKPKASTSAALFAGRPLTVAPVDRSWQAWWDERCEQDADPTIPLILSAVDTNRARHAIQNAWPSVILGASTLAMRAQVNYYAPEQGGPCLRCHNAPERLQADEDIIARLRSLPLPERDALARQEGVSPADLEDFLRDPHGQCGRVSGEALQRFASSTAEAAWSVGFVSLLAGVLLAAVYIRQGITPQRGSLNARKNLFRFQFWQPEAAQFNTLTSLPPQASCLCQHMPHRERLI